MKKNNLVGFKFGRLTVASEVLPKMTRKVRWNCICECGNKVQLIADNLASGHSKSCGCLAREITAIRHTIHSHTRDRGKSSEYVAWCHMRDRCNNHKAKSYRFYGQRGITVCDRWQNSFAAFIEDMGRKPKPELTIDRINSAGNYEPGNCKWSTMTEQQNNKQNNHRIEYNGIIQTLTQWARQFGIPPNVLLWRIRAEWPTERALTQPIRGR